MGSFSGARPELIQRASFDNILVVEDDADTREMLSTCIELETSYHVLSMANAEETLQYVQEIKEAKPCLFIFDYLLPTLTGLQLYDCLHAFQEFEHVPTIIITASTLNLELDRAIVARNLTLLLKPFDIVELIDRIKRVPIGPGQLI